MLTFDAQQALGFLVSQTAHIETQVYEIQYPDIQYPDLIPVDTSANEWAKSVTFYSMDRVGQADWFHHAAKDMPRADVERDKHERGIHMAGIGYGYSLEELGQAMMVPGTNLTADRGTAARRAAEEFIDGRALRGDAARGWNGLFNHSAVTRVAAADGASSSPDWASKTGLEMVADVDGALSGVHVESLTVEMADTVLLPVGAIHLMSQRVIPNTTMTALRFLLENNVYTQTTGQQLTVRGVRGLDTAGEGGTGRMVVYRRDPLVLKMHMPMPHRFLPVWQTGPMWFDVPGIFRFGGVEIRRPGAVRYIDDIINVEVGEGEGEGEGGET